MPNFKSLFVKKVLSEHSATYLKNQGLAIRKRVKFHTGNVYNNRTAAVTTDDQMDGKIIITHTAIERFLDIKRKIRSRATNRVKTRSLRIHNRFAYGHYYGIAEDLMYGATEEALDAIKKDFNTLSNG